MSFRALIFWLAVIVAFCVYLTGNYIDFARESNRVTVNHVLEGSH